MKHLKRLETAMTASDAPAGGKRWYSVPFCEDDDTVLGSTRFSREGLDAVIEKTTGRKEAEAAAGRCASCGHNLLIEGRIQGAGRLYFHPDKTRFWVFHESLVPTKAKACPACGYIQFFADAERLSKLVPNEEENEEEP